MGKKIHPSRLRFQRKVFIGMTKCPVTCGHPTSMTMNGFEKACRLMQKKIEQSAYDRICKNCKGKKLPKELTIIELTGFNQSAPKREEIQMAKQNIKTGTCTCCEEKDRSLKKHYSEMVCNSCQIVRIACRNRPEVVVNQLKKMHGKIIPGLREPIGPDNRSLAQELKIVREELGAATSVDLAEQIRNVVANNEKTSRKLAEVNMALGVTEPEKDPIPALVKFINEHGSSAGDSVDRQSLRDLGWKLIEGKLGGADHDLSVDDLKLLLGNRDIEQAAVNG